MTREDNKSQLTRLIWHYTTGRHFPSIKKLTRREKTTLIAAGLTRQSRRAV
jgi:hypothetical protein